MPKIESKMTDFKIEGSEGDQENGAYQVSWEPRLAMRIAEEVGEKGVVDSNGVPYLLAIVGVPGSGKSVSALLIQNELEKIGINAMIMPHDGYHYPLNYLKTFPDSDDLIYRRGAPDTFDSQALLRDLRRVKEGEEEIIKLPAFDHFNGDPEPDMHIFDRAQHRVVICEGLYLLHDKDDWEPIASMFDLKIFMNSDIDNCIERLKIRNRCIPGYSPEEIDKRCEEVDRVNAETAFKSKYRADMVIDCLVEAQPPAANMTSHHSVLDIMELAEADPDRGHRRSDSIVSLRSHARSDSVASVFSPDDKVPPPAASFVGTWEPDMADRIAQSIKKLSPSQLPYMVGLVGTPGSGKSVSAFLLANELEERGIETMVMPHDGYHYPLDYLRSFPDPEDAIYRRGAPDTFDPHALLRDLLRVKEGVEDLIKLPAFDHHKGDPEPDKHIFNRHKHKVVLCEGLYLFHNSDGWENIAPILELKIFMNSDIDICMERVKIRNLCIPGYTPEEIAVRVEKVDRVNALKVLSSKSRADVIVDSLALPSN